MYWYDSSGFVYFLGLVHEDLQAFLENNVPKSSKKQKVSLGVADSKIGAAITEDLQIQCSQTGVVPEVIRGIRNCPNYSYVCCDVDSAVKNFREYTFMVSCACSRT